DQRGRPVGGRAGLPGRQPSLGAGGGRHPGLLPGAGPGHRRAAQGLRPMAGLVIVSHSHRLAEGVVELVRQVAGPTVPVAAAGGLDAEQAGTSPELILEAIRQVGEGDVLVLMDLGSALLSAEMALEFLAPEERQRIRLVAAPLVEGAVAAAAVLAAGGDVEGAVREAREALRPKLDHLGEAPAGATTVEPGGAEVVRVEVGWPAPAGLHARPAGQLVREAARFDARIWARNKRQPQRRASLASLNELALLDARQHDTLILEASGPQGREALEALAALVRAGFGEIDPPASPTPGGDQEAGLGPGGAAVAGAGPAPAEAPAPPAPGTVLEGVAVTPGVAWGRTVQRRRAQAWTPQGPDRPPEEEWARLEAALHQVAAELAALQAGADAAEAGAIFEAQALFLQDPMLLEPARRAVEAGQPAAVAWLEACRATAAAYRELANPLLRQRAADVEDVGQRVFRRLTGQAADPAGERLEPGTILVVDELWPSDVAWLRDQPVAAVCAAQGDRTSHAAILARSLAVPVIVGLGAAILQLPEGTPGAVDGLRGRFYVAPDDGTLQALAQRAAHWQALERRARNEAGQPAALRGGRRVVVAANVGTPEEAREAARLGAEGVGLFRTEVLFVGRPQLPDTAAQEALYRQVAQAVAPHPVVLPSWPLPRRLTLSWGCGGCGSPCRRPTCWKGKSGPRCGWPPTIPSASSCPWSPPWMSSSPSGGWWRAGGRSCRPKGWRCRRWRWGSWWRCRRPLSSPSAWPPTRTSSAWAPTTSPSTPWPPTGAIRGCATWPTGSTRPSSASSDRWPPIPRRSPSWWDWAWTS